jgi:hypothetical protein
MTQVFWDVMVKCSSILFPTFRKIVPHGRASKLLKIQPVRFLEKSGINNPDARCNNPEELDPHNEGYKNLISQPRLIWGMLEDYCRLDCNSFYISLVGSHTFRSDMLPSSSR